MLLYNTLTKRKEALETRTPNTIQMFVCGPTVYDFAHLGHARTYVAFDWIVKYFRFLGYEVDYIVNITDVDDKIIQRAAEQGTAPKDLASRFKTEYLTDMEAVRVTAPSRYERATDHIPQIISQVERLSALGHAYLIEGDGVYFDIASFPSYGKLSGRTTEQAEDGTSRIDDSVQKRNKGDFALWKLSRKGEPSWDSPWGRGRPGWHIEDTAITEQVFGPQYDIHGGGRDLIFPHHEAEVTQMEALSKKVPFVRYWMHTGFLTTGGAKMSKSLGNYISIRDFLTQHSARLLRFFVFKTHYRSPIDYTEESIAQAEEELVRIDEFTYRLKGYRNPEIRNEAEQLLEEKKEKFHEALEDDFNSPQALAVLFELVKEGNTLMDQRHMSTEEAAAVLAFLAELDAVLGFIFDEFVLGSSDRPVPLEVSVLNTEREQKRRVGDWKAADELRARIEKAGWSVQDTPRGSHFKPLTNYTKGV